MIIPKFTTFSIVARDEKTGQIGVAGTTHWFGYGKNVPHIQAEIGAVATQASTNLFYGTEGLKQLEISNSAKETLATLLEREPDSKGIFQVIIIDKDGNTAGHTGENTIYFANHITEKNVAFAGNFLANENILSTMEQYYQNSNEPFALKLIKTLQRGQEVGGDIRGKRSAALKVTPKKGATNPWEDILYDLRIDDNADPLTELERQYYVSQSFHFLNIASEVDTFKEKSVYFEKALRVCPENSEALFWYAVSCWNNDEKEKAQELKEQLFQKYGNNWEELWKRFFKS